MKIVITIPAYNEERTIKGVIEEIKSVMGTKNYDYRILVLDDGSKDKTREIAEKAGAVVFSNKRNLGLAKNFKREMEESIKLNADIIVHTDADGQYPAKYIPLMIKRVEQGHDLVLGSRFGKGTYQGSVMKKIGNKIFASVFSRLLKTRLTDTTTGFRAFTAEVAGLPIINRFTYTQEQLIRAEKARMRICEIPIESKKTRESRLFNNSLDYAIKAWINILRIYRDFAPLKFFGLLGLALASTGFIIGIFFVYLHMTTGIVGHSGLLFLMIILIFTGIQTVLFGFLADMLKNGA